MPFATDVNVPDVGNITDPYGWLVCAGGEPLSGVSTAFSLLSSPFFRMQWIC